MALLEIRELRYCQMNKWELRTGHLGERMVRNHEVRGSIPLFSTTE